MYSRISLTIGFIQGDRNKTSNLLCRTVILRIESIIHEQLFV